MASILSSCGSAQSPAVQQITLYNGQHLQTTNALVAAFEKQTGIQVNVHSDDEDVLANQLIQEGSRSPADVFFTENSPALMTLEERGMLASVAPSTLAHVPSKYDSPGGEWVGVTARVNVLVYNTNLLKPDQVPTSILDLAKPQWKNKIAIAPSETDFQPIVTSVLRTYGQAATLTWLEGLRQNAGALQFPDNETLVDMVSRRSNSIDLCSLNQYYWYRERDMVGAREYALGHRLPRSEGPRLRPRCLRCRRLEVEPAQGRRSEISLLHREPRGTGDHRPLGQLRVPPRLGSDHCPTVEALRSAPTGATHYCRAR